MSSAPAPRPPGARAAVSSVRIEPARTAWLEALAQGDAAFTARFGIPVAPGWVGFPEALPAAAEAARLRDADPWGTHLIFDAADGALVGFGGFKGAAVDGRVEIGYAIAQERRNRGLGGAAVLLMVERARSAGVHVVVAHTLPEPNASTAVLTRCGFTRVATVEDPDDGVQVWRWELDLRR